MFRNKKVLSLFLSIALVISILLGAMPQTAFAQDIKQLTIVHVNDVHGRLKADSREKGMGFGVFKTKLDELRASNKNLLLLNAGDTFHGTTIVNLPKGEPMVEMMNLVKFDAMVPGNHDFNYGYDQLLRFKELADFDILGANIINEADGSSNFDLYVIKEFEGFKVGIFGLATPETKYKSHTDNTIGVKFENPLETAERAVKELKEKGVDMIIALGHLGIEGTLDATSKEVVEKVEGIDLFIDGHSHEELNLTLGDSLLVQAGNYMANMGVVEVEISDGKVTKKEAKLIKTEELEGLEPNPEVEALIEKTEELNRPILDVVVGSAKVELYGDRSEESSVRRNETILGNLISDVMRLSSGADMAFANGGGIRASIPQGVVKVDDIVKSFPFTNTLAVIEISGAELMAALEHGVGLYPEEAGWFPQVSGIKFTFDPNKPAGERILQVLVGEEEEALDLEAKYKLVTNDFMASGGDNYTMFEGKDFIAEGGLLSDVLIEHFNQVGEVEAKLESRIVALPLEEKVAEPEPEPEPQPEPKPEVKPEVRKYVVKPGDVLWRIARQFGTTWEKLAEYNKLKNPHLIFPNQTILIP